MISNDPSRSIYGQTEASPEITLMKPDNSPSDKSNILGPALPQTELKVIDPAELHEFLKFNMVEAWHKELYDA